MVLGGTKQAQIFSLVLALSAVACNGAEEPCVGPSCLQLDDEFSGAAHLLQLRSTDARVNKTVNSEKKCEKKTGGTCQFLYCDGSRNAECNDDRQCVCGKGHCNYDDTGFCVEEKQTTTELTTAAPATTTATSTTPVPATTAPATTPRPNDLCAVGDARTCPGSGTGCMGNQCCPGIDATNGNTFACPSASADFSGCGHPTKVHDCVSLAQVETAATSEHTCEKKTGGTCDWLGCDGSRNAQCDGGKCVCGKGYCNYNDTGVCVEEVKVTTTELTTAAPATTAVTSTTPVPATTAPATTPRPNDLCSVGDARTCPGSGNGCMGNQCCPGIEATNGNSFACPSASPDFRGCGHPAKVHDCLR